MAASSIASCQKIPQLGSSVLATTPNYRVKEYLPQNPQLPAGRNRGFEGISITPDEKTLFITMQSPLEYPTRALGRGLPDHPDPQIRHWL